jgi:hypothetical protein
MDIEKAFNQLTGNTDNINSGKIRGATKAEVRKLCGEDWDEKDWNRMVRFSNKAKTKIIGAVPFYNRGKKLWFWY